MKRKSSKLLRLIIIALSFFSFFGNETQGQTKQTLDIKDKDSIYLTKLSAKLSSTKGFKYHFKGTFISIPNELNTSLKTAFPKQRFRVGIFEYSHYDTYGASILLAIDDASGKVVGYCGDIFAIGCHRSKSFKKLLSHYQAQSENEALEKVATLAKLIAFPDWRIGKVVVKEQMIEAEFFTGGENPFRILKVPIGKNYKFGKFNIINPESGREH